MQDFDTLRHRVEETAETLAGAPEANGFIGIHNGGQADSHFSFVADPALPNVVYVGGDTHQATSTPPVNAPKLPRQVVPEGQVGTAARAEGADGEAGQGCACREARAGA